MFPFHKLPIDLLWAHILPQLGVDEFNRLATECYISNDHEFITRYLLPALSTVSWKDHYWKTINGMDFFKCLVENLPVELLKSWYNTLNIPHLCEIGQDNYRFDRESLWRYVIARRDTSLIEFFVHATDACPSEYCYNCCVSAMNDAIQSWCIPTLQKLGDMNIGFFPYHVFMALRTRNKVLFEYVFEPFIMDEEHRQMFIDHLQIIVPNDVSYYDAYHLQELYLQVTDLSHVLNTIATDKERRWICKQYQRIQKLLKIPGLRNELLNLCCFRYDDDDWDRYIVSYD